MKIAVSIFTLCRASPRRSSIRCCRSASMRHPTKEDILGIMQLAKAIKLFDSDAEIDELVLKPLEGYLEEATPSAASSQWWVTSLRDTNNKNAADSNSSSSIECFLHCATGRRAWSIQHVLHRREA